MSSMSRWCLGTGLVWMLFLVGCPAGPDEQGRPRADDDTNDDDDGDDDAGDDDAGDDDGGDDDAGDDDGGDDDGGDDDSEPPWLSLVSPADGAELPNPVAFRAEASAQVVRVVYDADGWDLGESTDAPGQFPLAYSFTSLGPRSITARGYDAGETEVASDSLTVHVWDGVAGVPYSCQYDNQINPSGSCQNTSVAMVLAHHGWAGDPDDISGDWGTSHAQSPAGLAEVFNHYATAEGLGVSMTPHTDGTVQDVRDLLHAGKPVIVHGYFTGYGHVVVTVGYDGSEYLVNDPAGSWSEAFMGGYAGGCGGGIGEYIRYGEAAFEAAIATSDGTSFLPVWYHELTP